MFKKKLVIFLKNLAKLVGHLLAMLATLLAILYLDSISDKL
jgi:hypothetical protein